VHPGVPATSVKEFVAHARAHPGVLNYGTVNTGEALAAAQFLKSTGSDMVRIPYKASPITELIAGRIQVYFGPVGQALAQSKEGRVRLLATLPPIRTPLTPDTPTLAESGYQGISGMSYQMLLAPAKTPRDVVEKLSREVNAALARPEVRAELEKVSLVPGGMTPAQLSKQIAEAHREWAGYFRDAGVVPQ
jgi:tripartite-type tricarboxylate transporter receptor subunit TctC